MYLGIEQALVGNRIGDIGAAIQEYAESRGYGVVRDLVGHGVGPTMHEEPMVPNYGVAGRGLRLKEGMVQNPVKEATPNNRPEGVEKIS